MLNLAMLTNRSAAPSARHAHTLHQAAPSCAFASTCAHNTRHSSAQMLPAPCTHDASSQSSLGGWALAAVVALAFAAAAAAVAVCCCCEKCCEHRVRSGPRGDAHAPRSCCDQCVISARDVRVHSVESTQKLIKYICIVYIFCEAKNRDRVVEIYSILCVNVSVVC